MKKEGKKPGTINREFEEVVKEMVKGGSRSTPQERTRQQVYATGNKWAIENFENTHN